MSSLQDHIKHFAGAELIRDLTSFPQQTVPGPKCIINGLNGQRAPAVITFNEELFSKHLLFLGNIGTGKTNAIAQVISQIKAGLTEDDLMIVFDTKGDYYQQFFDEHKDLVISNKADRFGGSKNYWNIFAELKAGQDDQHIREYAREIVANLFADKVKRSNAPFFPLAAQDLLATFLEIIIRDHEEDLHNNEDLMDFFDDASKGDLQDFFRNAGQERVSSYIGNDSGEQAAGVISELQQLLGEIFSGDFRRNGNLSIREEVRRKGGRTIFLEYDISMGQVLTPIYRLLFDLAIKETLSSSHRERKKGNVWFFIDEFSLLPNLKYLDNGINFGRSQGAKFIVALQNIPQAYHEYGELLAQSMLSGIRTVFAFHLDDIKSREFIQNRYGFAQKKVSYADSFGKSVTHVIPMKVIEDWDIAGMETGTSIVGPPDGNPFIFTFYYQDASNR